MMDDPWGSPWAAPDTDKDQKQLSPIKSDIALPPRAFLSASSSPRIPAAPEQPPWGGDEDGFGEWATASETPPAHSIWAGAWGGSSPNLAATPREDFLSKASPIAWPVSVATPKPRNDSAFRQPSPDPWASGFSSRRPSNEAASTPRLVVEAASPVEAPPDLLGKDGLVIEEGRVWDKTNAVDTSEQSPTEPHQSNTVNPKHIAEDELEEQPASASDSHVRVSVDLAAQNRDYQSSTPSNDKTDQEEERQASPGTSDDEEPKTLRPISRKLSGKVQELVVKFDGLARAASEEREPIQRARSRSPLRVAAGESSSEPSDFGDFEETDQTESLPVAEPSVAETPPELPQVLNTAPAALSSPPPDKTSTPSPIAKFGPLDFPVDLVSLSELFMAPTEPVKTSIVEFELPDHIISDSFAKISERKTWYRISRLGSSRRHNAGDDDNYRRVAWPSSSVHHDTIKIVRRWMEEDSIAGRVALGGGISKTQKNMFGWDSSAEPVALDAVFGKKRASHSRASSLQSLPTAGLKGIDGPARSPLQGPTHRASGSAGPAAASFGWDSSLPAPSAQTDEVNMEAKPPDGTAAFSAPVAPTSQTKTSDRPPVSPKLETTTGSTVPRSHGNMVDRGDGDDEWGEMVTSPVASQHATDGSSLQAPVAVPVSAAPVSQELRPVAQVIEDPWGKADFSVFGSDHAESSPSTAKLQRTPAKGPTTASELAPASSMPPPIPARPYPSSTPVRPTRSLVSNAQDAHDETAQRIIASLPDLSYMLR